MNKTDFDIIPDRDSIGSQQREIGFVATHNDSPQLLTTEQVDRWNADGYLGPLDVYDSGAISEIREYFDQLLAETFAEGKDSYSISSAHLKHAPVWDLLTNERTVSFVADLLGENVIGWGSHFFCKMPGDGKRVDWHQDCSYWPLTPTKAVTVWLAIDDADAENGCMEVFAGSHKHGLIDFKASDSNAGNVLDQTVEHPEQYGTHRLTPLRAGQISIHSDLLLHGSSPNVSDRRRCGLTLRYCPADVHAYLGWNQKGVVVRGVADPAEWPGAPRPS
ncbi:phytanoyl-CoA dioxygenase [Rhodopirellula maiorica SM1]|uniref:Phytanoyl-CoA dioxygenase n=1 Tax=Rhodopirellula maiorica SM1 TaxID=1265738 RepID=M5RZI6_9BACT|nr:phytanoyl-CoA dioxygenase family protein [Rhodopirellula maiorica]EMI19324.1 phytanoyl-CoA dioxygenase [Rhodopirellula maiorica SM1]